MPYAILRTAKLKTNGSIGASLDHNYRERKTHNADPLLTPNNEHALSSKDEAYNAILERLPENVRKDGVRCIEYMITASPEFFTQNTKQTQDEYFRAAKDWLVERHGENNVITTSIHRDETSPHLIAYVVPYVWNEKKNKETLNCKHFLGGRKTLSEMQTNFHQHVSHFGLERGVERSIAQHQTIKEFYAKIEKPMPTLEEIAQNITIPKPSLLESKQKYGITVANTVWEQANNYFENTALKTTYKNFKKLDQENADIKNKISSLENENYGLGLTIKRLESSNKLARQISFLPSKEKEALEEQVNNRINEMKDSLLKNPVREGINKVSYRWDKERNVLKFLINGDKVNSKTPLSFLNNLKSQDSFLSNFSNAELSRGELSFSSVKNKAHPKPFDVNQSGTKVQTQTNQQTNQQTQSRGFSL